jgi:hypothetical protein
MKTIDTKALPPRALGLLVALLIEHGCGVGAQSSADPPAKAPCQATVTDFLRTPSEASLNALSANACWAEFQSSTSDIQRLDDLVADGNAVAARLLSQHLGSLDGGELEDAHRSLGQFGALHMGEFLSFASSGELSLRNVTRALTMLPLELEESPEVHLEEMISRRSAVERVTDPQLAETRRAALAAIDSFIEDIERSKAAVDTEDRQRSR